MKMSKRQNFVLPEYIAAEASNSAYKVLGVSLTDDTVLVQVYDPLDVTDEEHNSEKEITLDEAQALVSVALQPQLFRAA